MNADPLLTYVSHLCVCMRVCVCNPENCIQKILPGQIYVRLSRATLTRANWHERTSPYARVQMAGMERTTIDLRVCVHACVRARLRASDTRASAAGGALLPRQVQPVAAGPGSAYSTATRHRRRRTHTYA